MTEYNTLRLLRCLGSLTGTRDTEFLETGLLKTLTEVLDVPTVSLVSDIRDGGQCKQTHYQRATQEIVLAQETLAPELLGAIRSTGDGHLPCEIRAANHFVTVFSAQGTASPPGYIVIVSETPLLEQAGRIVEAILHIYHNYYVLLVESRTDKLTGLLNRKTFDDSFGKILSLDSADSENAPHASRRRTVRFDALWMAVMDIDHFKRINDNFGHLYGDEVLVMTAHIMRSNLRKEDLLFRFGGEEFVIILNLETQDCARAALERLRNSIACHVFPQVGQVTVSIGAARVHGQVFPSEWFGRADQALYYAKAHGRNRVCFYEELLELGEIQTFSPKEGSIELF